MQLLLAASRSFAENDEMRSGSIRTSLPFVLMSQRSFHDHAYLELLKSSRIGESTLACQILDARHQEMPSAGVAPSVQIQESRQSLSDSVERCLSLLSALYVENTQNQPSSALLALWRRQTLEILFRPQ